MTTQHTPGPYRTDRDPHDPNGDLLIIAGPTHNAELIAVFPTDLIEPERAEANAALFAAAPELLEALDYLTTVISNRGLVTKVPGLVDAFSRALAAIAKAKGA